MGASFLNIVVLMFISVCAVALFKRVHLPPILAYLFAGVLAGPQLLSVFAHPEEMHLLAEVGIVFLLFSLGLEFSISPHPTSCYVCDTTCDNKPSVFGPDLNEMYFKFFTKRM